MIEIKTLNKNELLAYISSEKFGTSAFIPISKHRAISHCNNPRLSEEDVLLLLAFENDILVGYLGALPDILHFENKEEKGAWLSCLWIDPNHRGKKIAQKLLETCFAAWQQRIMITEFTFEAKILYDKSKIFQDLQIKKGLRWYIRSDFARILPPKKSSYAKLKTLLKVGDVCLNIFLSVKLAFFKKQTCKLKIEPVSQIDTEIENFISTFQEKQLFKRKSTELNWILNFPWILSAPEDELSKKYHFSSLANSFEFSAYKFYNSENELVAFIILAKRDFAFKTPYIYFEKEVAAEIAHFINSQIINLKIKTFTTYNKDLIEVLKTTSSPAFHHKTVERKYLISKVFGNQDYDSFDIQDGDADCSFT